MVELSKVQQRVAENPDSREFTWLASELVKSGRLEDAIAILNKGIQFYPKHLPALILKAKAIHSLASSTSGDLTEAKSLWLDINQTFPSTLISLKGLMEIALEENDLELSRKYYNELKHIDPYVSLTSLSNDTPTDHPPLMDSELDLSSEDIIDEFVLDESPVDVSSHEVATDTESEALDLVSGADLENELPPLDLTNAEVDLTDEDSEFNFEVDQNTESEMELDSQAVGAALDDIFGDDNDDFAFSEPIQKETDPDNDLVENLELNSPMSEIQDMAKPEKVDLPTLQLEDDEELSFSEEESLFGEEAKELTISEEPATSNVPAEDDLLTGTDVSDALDEIFGELEDDDFDESLLGSSDTERIVPKASTPEDVELSASTDDAEDIFGDSEETLDILVESTDDEILNPPQNSLVDDDIENKGSISGMGDAVADELDSIFGDESDDEFTELIDSHTEGGSTIVDSSPSMAQEEVSVESESSEDSEDSEGLTLTQGDYVTDTDSEGLEFVPVEEEANSVVDELTTLDSIDEDIFSGIEETNEGDDFYDITGEANSGSFFEDNESLSSLDIDEDIDESIFEDPTSPTGGATPEKPTATLAEIYFQQELYEKALEIYQTLSASENQSIDYSERMNEIKKQIDAQG